MMIGDDLRCYDYFFDRYKYQFISDKYGMVQSAIAVCSSPYTFPSITNLVMIEV